MSITRVYLADPNKTADALEFFARLRSTIHELKQQPMRTTFTPGRNWTIVQERNGWTLERERIDLESPDMYERLISPDGKFYTFLKSADLINNPVIAAHVAK